MIAPQKRYSHVIWDWNGTLVDDVWLCLEILNEILSAHGKPIVSRNQYISLFKHPVKEYYEDLGFDFSQISFDDIAAVYNEEYDKSKHRCRLHQGAESVLSMIRSSGIDQSILSAYQQHRLEESAKHFGVTEHFKTITGLDDCYAFSKLDSGRDLMCELGINPSETVLVGDTHHDYDVANELEIDCILIANGHNSTNRLMECGDVVILNSIAEVTSVLM